MYVVTDGLLQASTIHQDIFASVGFGLNAVFVTQKIEIGLILFPGHSSILVIHLSHFAVVIISPPDYME